MNRHIIKIFSIFLFYLLISPGCPFVFNASAEDLSPDMKRIMKQGKIVVAMYYEDIPPFIMHDRQGNLFGYDIDLANDLGKRMGVKIEFNRKAKTFDEVVEIVANRKADIAITVLSRTLERAIKVGFSRPYVLLHQALLINRLKVAKLKIEKDPVNGLNHKDAKIGVIEGSSYVGFAKQDFPMSTIIPYRTWDEVMKDVLEGKIHAGLYDEIEINNWRHAHPGAMIYIQPVIINDRVDPIAIAMHWEDTHLRSIINLYTKIIKKNGMIERLRKTYLIGDAWRDRL